MLISLHLSMTNFTEIVWYQKQEQVSITFHFLSVLLRQEICQSLQNTLSRTYSTDKVLCLKCPIPLSYPDWSNLSVMCMCISIYYISANYPRRCKDLTLSDKTVMSRERHYLWLESEPWNIVGFGHINLEKRKRYNWG